MKVELLQTFGNDLDFANVARVSYNKEASNYTEEQNTRLLNYLVKHGHTSPFRHSLLQFRIECPIYVARQLDKHQIGISVNSISGRYVDFSDSYTLIEQFRKQSTDSKQGSAEDLNLEQNEQALDIQNEALDTCKNAYLKLLNLGVSKEQARSVLPMSLNTTFIMSCSFLAFAHLCNLRLKPDAQKETRDVVALMLEQVKGIEGLKETINAFKL